MKKASFSIYRCTLLFSVALVSSAYRPDLQQDVRDCLPDCKSQIFCSGELLHDVQVSRVFGRGNGTRFVEKRLLFPENEILVKYKQLKSRNGGQTPSTQQLRKFVDENFADDLLQPCNFPDFNPNPSILNRTNVGKYKTWLRALNELWKQLGGQISEDVKKNPDRHSFLYVPNKFIRAGGRFTGTYYWDSYWIVKGLLLSDMVDTARGIIENIIYLVERFDHMPNGNRIFYTTRSQPPMLITMAALYYEFTNDFTFLQKNIKFLEKEFAWWVKHRGIYVTRHGKEHFMFRYKSISCVPRPESYAEDYELVENVKSNTEKVRIFTGIRSAAETGWDFSSRHVRDPSTPNNKTLLRMEPQNMVYVDLNSIMHSNAKYLADWNDRLGKRDSADYYRTAANNLLDAIGAVLWNEEEGTWLDYDLILEKPRKVFYISNLTPLWSDSFINRPYIVERSVQYLVRKGIVGPPPAYKPSYFCVPTSIDNSTQQWDFPNCWAPLQAFLIQGLRRGRDVSPAAEKIAFNLARQWIDTTYEGFRKNRVMYEKYSATTYGSSGGGGEYNAQTGFGWTNGFCMELFSIWGPQFS